MPDHSRAVSTWPHLGELINWSPWYFPREYRPSGPNRDSYISWEIYRDMDRSVKVDDRPARKLVTEEELKISVE
jgi:hypothetical protein